MLLVQLDESIKYEELVSIAKSAPYGRVVVNKNNLPILYRHPFMNECLLLGYKPQTKEVAFAETLFLTVDSYSTLRWDPAKVIERYKELQRDDVNITVVAKSATIQEFIQQFFLLHGFTWAANTTSIKHVNESTQVICGIYNPDCSARRLAYSDHYQEDEIEFNTFWNTYFKF